MRNKVLFIVFFLAITHIALFSVRTARAVSLKNDIMGQVSAGAVGAGFDDPADPRKSVSIIINFALSTLGTLFIILIVMSGYWYLTARGDEERVRKASRTISSAIVGLILVLLSYSITVFVSKETQDTLIDPQERAKEEIDKKLNKVSESSWYCLGQAAPWCWNWGVVNID